ncbi:hypothetical protein C8R47DRAFT_1075516 [Mycena vitilis]|nr:hypothetical protein C8R47DRAFT_1075516 [Mycena vitilis]
MSQYSAGLNPLENGFVTTLGTAAISLVFLVPSGRRGPQTAKANSRLPVSTRRNTEDIRVYGPSVEDGAEAGGLNVIFQGVRDAPRIPAVKPQAPKRSTFPLRRGRRSGRPRAAAEDPREPGDGDERDRDMNSNEQMWLYARIGAQPRGGTHELVTFRLKRGMPMLPCHKKIMMRQGECEVMSARVLGDRLGMGRMASSTTCWWTRRRPQMFSEHDDVDVDVGVSAEGAEDDEDAREDMLEETDRAEERLAAGGICLR